jgi:hypothetical protein
LPPNFIFWLGRLIFSVSINSHPDNIPVYLIVNFHISIFLPVLKLCRTSKRFR